VRDGEEDLDRRMNRQGHSMSNLSHMNDGRPVVTFSNRVWHRVAWLVRLDMAVGVVLAIALLVWLQWN
jgi:hypothetical protein